MEIPPPQPMSRISSFLSNIFETNLYLDSLTVAIKGFVSNNFLNVR